jgi:hypothetical protein
MEMTKHRINNKELIIIIMHRTKEASEGDPVFKEVKKVQDDFFAYAEPGTNSKTGHPEYWNEVLISDEELNIISRLRAGVTHFMKEPD